MKQQIEILAAQIWQALPHVSKFRALYLAVLKTKLIESLKNGMSFFTYTKEKGEKRNVIGTLDAKITPPYQFKTSGKAFKNEAALLTVWCTEKAMWRTFRIDRVQMMYV